MATSLSYINNSIDITRGAQGGVRIKKNISGTYTDNWYVNYIYPEDKIKYADQTNWCNRLQRGRGEQSV